ncbi:glutamyl-tRNA reductase [Oligoflexus tunisiensis]|uniref:glutamyl-tRNA reductase n=1 Tax=Oligoflexus tunisiensis TaxID=708132 RepID=UPI000ABE5847|nr:glutamyl-tRNA reductase [Oligoflexus tunisiensis]
MAEKVPILFCVGTNHESAGLDFRETLFLSREEIDVSLPQVIQKHGLREVMVLSTCNRLELYGVMDSSELTSHHLREVFIDLQRFCPNPKKELDEEIKHRSYHYLHKDAARHAFSVASGLDSLVLGETQITGQFKNAAQFAQESGTLGPILKRLTQEAFSSSKKVRSNTDIGKKPVSISHAAIDLANRVYGDIADCRVLIIGAGEMAEVAAKYLLKYNPRELFVCNRTLARAEGLVEKIGIGIAYPWEELNEVLTLADVVISCTAANEIVLDKPRIQRSQTARNKPVFLIDIALPRDIDKACAELEDVYLFDIDDLKQVVGENYEERRRAAEKGKQIIVENAEGFDKWLSNLNLKPALGSFREYLDALVAQEFQKSFGRSPLNSLDENQIKAAEAMLKSIVNKINGDAARVVHNPPVGYTSESMAEALKSLFSMDKNS